MTLHRGRLLVALLTLFAVMLPLWDMMGHPGSPLDEGSLLLYPELVLKGAVPYRDFESFYGPASIYALVLPYSAFGVNIAVERSVGLLYRLLALGALYLLLERRSLVLAVGGTLLATVILLPTGVTAFAWMGAMACALWAIWLCGQVDDRRRCFFGGLLAGLALLYRPDTGPAVILATLPLFLLMPRAVRRSFLLGGAVSMLPLALVTVVAGPMQILNNFFLYPVLYSSPARHMPASVWPPYLTAVLGLHAASVLLNLSAGAAAVWTDRGSREARTLLGLALFGLALTHQAVQRVDYIHVPFAAFISIAVAPLSLSLLWGLARRSSGLGWIPAAASLAVVAGALGALSPEFPRFAGVEAWRQLTAEEIPVLSLKNKGRSFPMRSPQEALLTGPILEDLNRLGRPGQRLFVGPGDLRRTNANDTFLYHLLPQFVPATYFLEMNPLSANRPGSRLASDVASADWLILNRFWDAWGEPNRSVEFGSDAPNEVVRTQFERCARHGSVELYRRKAPPQGT